MENAAKALLIAAGMFFTILIISLLVIRYNQVSSYYEEKNKLTEIEQTQKINDSFQNYHGNEIRGNELISILNRIVDYNNLQADMQGYQRIIINVNLLGHADELAYDGNATLFGSDGNISNRSNDNEIRNLAEASINLTASAKTKIEGLTELKLQKMSENAHYIVLENPTEEEKIERAQKLTRILGYTVEKNDNVNNIIDAVKKYEQLKNFKKAMFKCTEVLYDTNTGRVNGMRFTAIETEDGRIKLD